MVLNQSDPGQDRSMHMTLLQNSSILAPGKHRSGGEGTLRCRGKAVFWTMHEHMYTYRKYCSLRGMSTCAKVPGAPGYNNMSLVITKGR